ncbi:hypothetical protein CON65_08710 [Bacillus pseudomycoides]|uniref:Uncharacterized protein n=1 Tax=Bacillus pseudomycoides TaxID=64104 RepID=A0AA91VCU7_9BACI|nr:MULTISPECIES: flagellar export chaperone FlgN [Bacillus]PEB53951.1 hypothetical protein COO03_06925 [Bacillus sp. AFS098217]PED82936.1 hypothetical protein CON65_08710 [Bacillus pseudomycoides]PEU07457.1 hypothetical protein CN524_20635 [Bacillus sp. AFS019443]PEU17421.1 hypothetical protein CN525_14745 [Bacillus sp. AFS014408]PFW62553.1 hypothetical protein COL20_12900 [Bacillus sp. AFS075034]
MYIQLYEKLVLIQKAYENISVLGEQMYENLQQKNVSEVQKLQVEQMQYIDGVKQLTTAFQEMIEQFCKENGIEPYRMQSLFSYFSEEEIEKIKELQKTLTTLEENVKMILSKNQYYLNVLLKITEGIVDSVSEYNLERNHNSQIFINELL